MRGWTLAAIMFALLATAIRYGGLSGGDTTPIQMVSEACIFISLGTALVLSIRA